MPFRRAASRLRALARRRQFDAAMDEEMRFHVEMQAERLAREQGVDPVEARRQALAAFGGVEKWKEAGRDVRGGRWVDHLSLDARLGVRMLAKHPSLTVIGVFSMTVAIAIGAAAFELVSEALNPALPFPGGERAISIEYATELPSVPEKPGVHDFFDWREALDSVEHLGASRGAQYNLATAASYPDPVRVAEVTASAFTLAQTPPQLGRYLVRDDEREGAAPVVVIGHHEWQRRFAGDAGIVGRIVTLNTVPHAIVGVMPEGFAFPLNYQYWIPLRENPARYERPAGPKLAVFGLLAPGRTRGEAEAQLAAMHNRLASANPAAYGRLRPMVLPYTLEVLDIDRPIFVWVLRMVQVVMGALLIVVAVNLSILF
jgi:hypothetical protein